MKNNCNLCGKYRIVHRNCKSGKLICGSCHQESRTGICVGCRKKRPIVAGKKTLIPICKSCHQKKNIGKCIECEEEKIIQARKLCYKCYKRQWIKKKA